MDIIDIVWNTLANKAISLKTPFILNCFLIRKGKWWIRLKNWYLWSILPDQPWCSPIGSIFKSIKSFGRTEWETNLRSDAFCVHDVSVSNLAQGKGAYSSKRMLAEVSEIVSAWAFKW
jgi:hypothetical protein